MSIDASASTTTHASSHPSAVRTWGTGLLSTVTAVAVNVGIFVAGRAAGADMLVRREVSEQPMTVGLGLVAAMTILPMLAATLLLLAMRRWDPRAWRVLALIGLIIGLATVPAPFTVLAETSTQVTLALMHAVAGAAWFIAVHRAAARWED